MWHFFSGFALLLLYAIIELFVICINEFPALKKSQKEANILVQRSTTNKAVDMHGQEKPEVVDLRSSLMGQWRSLFSHMEDMFAQESSQLVS